MVTGRWKSWSARTITKVKRSQFTVATRKRLSLYFRSAAARNYGLANSMIKPWRFCAVVLSASTAFSLAADESPGPVPDVEIRGTNVRPGYPDAFALGYRLVDDSISPDGKYAVISPN